MKFARQLGSKNLNERAERLPALLHAFAGAFFGELARHEMRQQNVEVAADLARPLWQTQQKKGRKMEDRKMFLRGEQRMHEELGGHFQKGIGQKRFFRECQTVGEKDRNAEIAEDAEKTPVTSCFLLCVLGAPLRFNLSLNR